MQISKLLILACCITFLSTLSTVNTATLYRRSQVETIPSSHLEKRIGLSDVTSLMSGGGGSGATPGAGGGMGKKVIMGIVSKFFPQLAPLLGGSAAAATPAATTPTATAATATPVAAAKRALESVKRMFNMVEESHQNLQKRNKKDGEE